MRISAAFVAIGLVLMATGVANAVSSGGSSPLKTVWSLPIGVGPVANTGASVVASDVDTVYASDSRGTLFAVRAADGKLLWTYDGHSTLYTLQLYPEIPDMVYYVTVDPIGSFPTNFTVRALRKSDGNHVGTLRNLTNSYTTPLGGAAATLAPLRASGGGLVALHSIDNNFGIIQGFDKTLNTVRWTVSNGVGHTQKFDPNVDHIGANKDIVFTINHPDWPFHPTFIGIDSYTGKVVCNMSNISATQSEDLTSVFLTKENTTILNYGGFGTYDSPTVVNAQKCTHTEGLSYNSFDGQRVGDQWLNRTFGNDSVTLIFSDIGASKPLWTKTLKLRGPGTAGLKFTAGSTPFDADSLVLWWPGGDLVNVNRTTGKTLWTVKSRLPIAPPNNNGHFVFPLGDHKLFVPNLQGYIIVDVKTGTILADVEDAPSAAAFSFRAPRSRSS